LNRKGGQLSGLGFSTLILPEDSSPPNPSEVNNPGVLGSLKEILEAERNPLGVAQKLV